jgi:RNA ligase-like protein
VVKIYPKIDTLFVRDAAFKLTEQLRRPVLGDIQKWIVTEKVDGTNIRVSKTLGTPGVEFNGRSDNAQIPGDLVQYIIETFTEAKMDGLFLLDSMPGTRITLFGEGYGGSIQKGAGKYGYPMEKQVILFDALIEMPEGDCYWQSDDVVTRFADLLGVQRVPVLGEFDLNEIVTLVRVGVPSRISLTEGAISEGIVARTREPLFDARGNRLILKLKTSDFK